MGTLGLGGVGKEFADVLAIDLVLGRSGVNQAGDGGKEIDVLGGRLADSSWRELADPSGDEGDPLSTFPGGRFAFAEGPALPA